MGLNKPTGKMNNIEPSANRRSKMSGTLVGRRISEELYEETLNTLKEEEATATAKSAPAPEGRKLLLRYPPGKAPIYRGICHAPG
jgi:hypothetical protein